MSFRSKNEDRLSILPEEVLSHILSLMPTKYAVRSCILSKRWRCNWTLVTNLEFDDIDPVYGKDCFLKFVDRVLEHYKTSKVNLFRLRFSGYMAPKSSVSMWIDEAIKLNICELDIKVRKFELPLNLFTCKTLTKLRLDGSGIGMAIHFPVILPSLKTLNFTVEQRPSLNAFRLINGCPVLETLSLVIIFHDDEGYTFNIPTLKRLELTTRSPTSVINKYVLNVPNLEYLYVGGYLGSAFVMEDLSSLFHATVSYRNHNKKCLMDELLKGISGAKSLLWTSPNFDVVLKSHLPKFPNLRHLELKGSLRRTMTRFARELESPFGCQRISFEEYGKPCSIDIEPQSVPTWMLTNLRTLKITICKGRDCDIRFIEYMLGNAEVLKTLTITCEGLLKKDEMWLSTRLLTLPRASRYCQIQFVGKWLNSRGK